MLQAHYISMSLATVIWECSLNQFSTSLFVSLFVHREPQQIFMGVNTEYRANLVKARVMFQSRCFTYTWSVSILSYFQNQKAGRGLLNLKTLEYYLSDKQ